MRTKITARNLDTGAEPTHTIEIVCGACGFDLDESELAADTCSDCGEPLDLKQSVSIEVTTLPLLFGDTI